MGHPEHEHCGLWSTKHDFSDQLASERRHLSLSSHFSARVSEDKAKNSHVRASSLIWPTTASVRAHMLAGVQCISDKMTLLGIGKSVIQTDCHIKRWFSSN